MKKKSFLEQPRRGNPHEGQLTPHKAAGRSVGMIAALLILAVCIAACDPGYTEDVVIHNAIHNFVMSSPLPPMRKSSLSNWAASAVPVSREG